MVIKSIIKLSLFCSRCAFILTVIYFSSCSPEINEAQSIVNKTIEVHGGKAYDNVFISFDFRNRNYTITRKNGEFIYTRSFTDTLGQVKDVLDNKGFARHINGQPVELSDEWVKRYSSSVNSVAYFALLPMPLNDEAVIKVKTGEEFINEQAYYKIKVTFSAEGGGEDYKDNFFYWIHKNNFTMDFFAYDYESDGGGSRFRQAINQRRVGGIMFQDYINYEPEAQAPLEDYAHLWENDELKQLSVINLENVEVRRLK